MHRLVVIAFVAACGDPQLERLQVVKDEVCACKTAACGEAAMKKVPQDKHTSAPRLQRVANDMLDCMAKLYDESRPTTDPDAETPDVSSPGSAAP
ncbi:MAG TPA: hypothetical protein VK427_03905 [Kofleriaceae bacterium]|nr:hypothetical protein [Kofleriaceae bacterium]